MTGYATILTRLHSKVDKLGAGLRLKIILTALSNDSARDVGRHDSPAAGWCIQVGSWWYG